MSPDIQALTEVLLHSYIKLCDKVATLLLFLSHTPISIQA